jgi:hypothetical protein
MTDEPVWQDEPSGDQDDARRAPAAASTLVRLGAADRGPGLLVVAIVIFVAVALIKPWPGGAAPAPASGQVRPPSTDVPTDVPSADPLAGIRLDCQDPPGFRIFSRESWSRGTLRSWRTFDPLAEASGPLDAAIPDVPIGPGILGLGYCAAWSGSDRPPDDAAVQAWATSLTGGGPVPLRLVPASATLHPPLGGLYLPPAVGGSTPPTPRPTPKSSGVPGVAPDGPTWAPGTYVFELAAPGWQRWWAITVLPDDRPAVPSPKG